MTKKIFVGSILVLAFALYLRSGPKLGKIVKVNEGSIQGSVSSSRDGREFYAWHHIPFAKAPVGELRFADPVPPEKWDGVREGLRYGPKCAQMNFPAMGIGFDGEEDCLHLNVFVPKNLYDASSGSSTKKSPVLVYIHQGCYIGGGADVYGPEHLMDEDIIVVTINYRLDILGFLTTGDKVVRGNMGLKDQSMALRWIHANIHNFGGDPRQVTVAGTSAGGASAHLHMLSKWSKDLFQKAFSQSGVGSNTWGLLTLERSLEKTREAARMLKCPSEDSQKLVACLRRADFKDILETVEKSSRNYFLFNPHSGLDVFGPIVEAVKDEAAFLTQHPLQATEEGKAQPVPWLVGYCSHEGLAASLGYVRAPENIDKFDSNAEEHVRKIFAIHNKNGTEISRKILEFYSLTNTGASFEEKFPRYTDMFGDAFFTYDIHKSAGYQRKYSPVYYYVHSKTDGTTLCADIFANISGDLPFLLEVLLMLFKGFVKYSVLGYERPHYGTPHTQDLSYLFTFMGISLCPSGSENYQYSKDLVRLLVDFMRDDTNMKFRGVSFPPLPSKGPLKTFEFSNNGGQVVPEAIAARMKFLNFLRIRLFKND